MGESVGELEGDTVVVSSKEVPKPTRVRYGYASRRPWAGYWQRACPMPTMDGT